MSRKVSALSQNERGNPYVIEWVRFGSGERLPVLVRRESGLPIESPTYWITASERPLNKAAATLEKQLRHLMFLYLWADYRGVTPEDLVRSDDFFTLEELNDLDRFCRQNLGEAVTVALSAQQGKWIVIPFRGRVPKNAYRPGIPADVKNRLAAIHAFLDYASFARASRMAVGSGARQMYEENRKFILKAMLERSRTLLTSHNIGEPREGLSEESRHLLLAVIKPGHADNPYEPRVQRRNELIIRLLYELGMRRGELLSLRVGDIKLTPDAGLLTIQRRPQDPEDPRQTKPQVKSLGRELAMGPGLRELFSQYLIERRTLPAAKRHPFLFVSTADGSPLSLWTITKIFSVLRQRVPSLPQDFSAHVLRHDWNDRFSEMSDRASPHRTDLDATKEERLRAYAQGWSNPATAAVYTRRWTRESANKRSLAMQEQRKILVERTDERRVSQDKPNDSEREE